MQQSIKAIIQKNWWLPLLVVFDFIYYYFIKHITTPNRKGFWVEINWEGFVFFFIISLISLACVRWVKGRLGRLARISIQAKYLQILLYSFFLFIIITASSQFLIEYAAGQQRNLAYILGNGLIYVFLHLIVGNAYIAIAFFREFSQLKQDLILAEKAKTESELRVLQQQMSPHFLFNNLNTLSSLIPQDEKKAIRFAQRLSGVFRYVSQNARRSVIPLSEELKFLDNYMELMRYRFGEAYVLENNMEEIDPTQVFAIPMALQLLIENVIKHNSGNRAHSLLIELYTCGDKLCIKNQFRPKQAISEQALSGIGLENLSERYRLISGQDIHFGQQEGHFLVQLPLIKRIDDESIDH